MAITFPTSLTIEDCEKFIGEAAASRGNEALILPVEVGGSAFGGLAAAIQAVNTWGRPQGERKVLLRGNVETLSERVTSTINRPHKFCASMLAKSIEDAESGADVRSNIYRAASDAIDQQMKNPFGQQRGPLCWFIFVDHSTKGFDRNFYLKGQEENPEPRQLKQIRSLIQAMVEKSIRIAGGGRPLDEEDSDHLGRIFFELFLNTHEHGTRAKTKSD